MTEDEIMEAARRHVATWQPRLGLANWRIALKVGPTDDDTSAHSEGMWTWEDASITVSPDFEKDHDIAITAGVSPGRVLEEIVIHELLHLTDQPMAAQVSKAINRIVGKDGVLADSIHGAFSDYSEMWINRVVKALMVTHGSR